MPGLAQRAECLYIDLKQSLLFRNLKATLVFPGGIVLGRHISLS